MLKALSTRESSSMSVAGKIRYPAINKRVVAFVGGFGSGKTEVSVNFAKFLRTTSHDKITIADLDLVNPYFRSREATQEMEAMGIRVISPTGGQFYADLPILLPSVKGAIENPDGRLVLDVGGDSQGTKALGSLSGDFDVDDYDMLMVLNSRRPQTADVAGSLNTMARIETSARLKFTGLVSNSHMIDDTDFEVIREGYELAREISRESGLPIAFISAKGSVLKNIDVTLFKCPILPLTRSMLKPWERREIAGGDCV
jgi:hypothetical protein